MILLKTAADMADYLSGIRARGLKTGFVPTMGALHEGHLSLIAASRGKTDFTICSIFVNPTQFNDPVDFEKYPVTIENDIRLLEQAGCDLLFLPSVAEIYPNGTNPTDNIDAGYLDTVLEGSKRPGHFKGVLMVMSRLLAIVSPSVLFLGQKDYQQCMVIGLLTKDTKTALVIVPTMRGESGLAMSSRNTRLSTDARSKATVIYRALQHIKLNLQAGDLSKLKADAEAMILSNGFDQIDYVSIADASTLEPIENWDGKRKVVALVAAFIEGVRLIDNLILNQTSERIRN